MVLITSAGGSGSSEEQPDAFGPVAVTPPPLTSDYDSSSKIRYHSFPRKLYKNLFYRKNLCGLLTFSEGEHLMRYEMRIVVGNRGDTTLTAEWAESGERVGVANIMKGDFDVSYF